MYEPLKLEPIYDRTIWAGDRLCRIRHHASDSYGTVWEMTVHPYAQSVVTNPQYHGQKLKDLIEKDPEGMLGKKCTEMDLIRLAYLDAKDSLSVQVHPDEAYAVKNENDHGKTESWYILEAEPGATLVAGSDFTDKEQIRQAIGDHTIMSHLRNVPVKAGDFICIEAGTLHALGAGILAIEVGTNSNTTYRFYDYERKDAKGNERPLHLDKSLDVVNLSSRPEVIHSPYDPNTAQKKMLLERKEFTVELVDTAGKYASRTDGNSYQVLSNMQAECLLKYDGGTMPLHFTQTVFLPAALGEYEIIGSTRILVSSIRK